MSYGSTPKYFPVGGLWTRKGHASIAPPNAPPPPAGYDWTTNPYGSVYDSRASGIRDAGGYLPDASTSGIPTGTTLTSTVSGTSGYLTLSGAAVAKGTGTATASNDTITLTGHGLSNGHPIYFTSLTGGSGLSTGPLTWYVVDNATTNTFTLKKCDPNTGLFAAVDITANYSAVAVTAGVWYDKTDFTCHVTTTSSAVGLVLITRSKHRGPATALGGFNGESQGMIYNLSSNMHFISADSDFIPDAPVNKLNATYGSNVWVFRQHTQHVIDNHGSLGNCHLFGGFQEKFAWFYPAPNQTNGSHCDALVQIHLGDIHVARGNNTQGFIDATVSSTTNPTSYPIPSYTTSCVLVGAGSPAASNLDIERNNFSGAVEHVNVADYAYPALGSIFNNQHHLRDSQRGQYTQGIVAPQSHAGGTGSPITLHADIPGSGSRASVDENNTAIVPFAAAGVTLVWP